MQFNEHLFRLICVNFHKAHVGDLMHTAQAAKSRQSIKFTVMPKIKQNVCIVVALFHCTGIPQILAKGLSVGKGLLHKITLTTLIRPWSY